MNKRLFYLVAMLLLQAVFVLPAQATPDSTNVEHDKNVGFFKEFVPDELDRLIMIENIAIWEPFSLDEEDADGDFLGVLLSDGTLRLSFSVPVGQSQIRVFRNGLPILVTRIQGSGEEDLPLGTVRAGRYVVFVLPEESEENCFYVGRFTIE